MPKGIFPCIVCACLLLIGCSSKTDERLSALEVSVEELRLQEPRIALLEDRANSLSADVGTLQRSSAMQVNDQAAASARNVSRPTSRSVRASSSSISSVSATPSAPGKGENAAYAQALTVFERNNYTSALSLFTAFLQTYPSSKLAPNAMYWNGECYYGMKQYDKAILTFKDVVVKYPKHPKAAAAMLKAGFAYERHGDKDNARFYLQMLLQDFPLSEPATLARKKLTALQ